jgi:hypothetical protein
MEPFNAKILKTNGGYEKQMQAYQANQKLQVEKSLLTLEFFLYLYQKNMFKILAYLTDYFTKFYQTRFRFKQSQEVANGYYWLLLLRCSELLTNT